MHILCLPYLCSYREDQKHGMTLVLKYKSGADWQLIEHGSQTQPHANGKGNSAKPLLMNLHVVMCVVAVAVKTRQAPGWLMDVSCRLIEDFWQLLETE